MFGNFVTAPNGAQLQAAAVGPKGSQGNQGIQGNPGVGIKGDQGAKGDKGDTGVGTVGPAGPSPLAPIVTWVAGLICTATAPATFVAAPNNAGSFECVIPHTATNFSLDLAAGRWIIAAPPGPQGNPGATGSGSGNVLGPPSSVAGHIATYADPTGTVLADGGALGDAAFKNTGTTVGTLAAGNDPRFGAVATEAATRAAQTAFNFCAGILL